MLFVKLQRQVLTWSVGVSLKRAAHSLEVTKSGFLQCCQGHAACTPGLSAERRTFSEGLPCRRLREGNQVPHGPSASSTASQRYCTAHVLSSTSPTSSASYGTLHVRENLFRQSCLFTPASPSKPCMLESKQVASRSHTAVSKKVLGDISCTLLGPACASILASPSALPRRTRLDLVAPGPGSLLAQCDLQPLTVGLHWFFRVIALTIA